MTRVDKGSGEDGRDSLRLFVRARKWVTSFAYESRAKRGKPPLPWFLPLQ